MLELYGKPTSINVRKVLWLCAGLDLDVRHHAAPDADLLRGLNPNMQVPVLREGGFVLWESNSICRYLATRAGRYDLLPAEPQARSRVEQWMDWQATDLNTAWRHVFMAFVCRACSPAPAQRQRQRQKRAFRGVAGWVRLRGTLQVRPCKLGRRIHAAHAPATGPTPPSTVSRC